MFPNQFQQHGFGGFQQPGRPGGFTPPQTPQFHPGQGQPMFNQQQFHPGMQQHQQHQQHQHQPQFHHPGQPQMFGQPQHHAPPQQAGLAAGPVTADPVAKGHKEKKRQINTILARPKKIASMAAAAFRKYESRSKPGMVLIDKAQLVYNELLVQFQVVPEESDKKQSQCLFKKLDGKGGLGKQEFEQFFLGSLYRIRDRLNPPNKLGRIFQVSGSNVKLTKRYKLEKKIGEGAFGTVRLCKELASGKVRVCKSVPKAQTGVPVEEFRAEIEIMRQLDHPHVLRIFEYFEDFQYIHVICEFIDGGDLMETVEKRYGQVKQERTVVTRVHALTESWVAKCTRQILLAVAYCHEMRIMHKDLKLQNVMLRQEEPVHCVVIDFGLAQIFNPDSALRQPGGSPLFMAPEVFKQNFGPKADVWSIGVIVFTMLTGNFPINANSLPELRAKLCGHAQPDWNLLKRQKISPKGIDFVKAAMTKSDRSRPTVKELLNSGWFIQRRQSTLEGMDVALPSHPFQHLVNFQKNCFFMKAMQNAVAARLNSGRKSLNEVNSCFRALDKDNTGKLSMKELSVGLKRIGLSSDEIEEAIRAINVTGSEAVEYNEFVAACSDLKSREFNEHLWSVFDKLDADHDGHVRVQDLAEFLGGHQDAILKELPDGKTPMQIVKEADKNGDGVLSFAEFQSYCKTQSANQQKTNALSHLRPSFSMVLAAKNEAATPEEPSVRKKSSSRSPTRTKPHKETRQKSDQPKKVSVDSPIRRKSSSKSPARTKMQERAETPTPAPSQHPQQLRMPSTPVQKPSTPMQQPSTPVQQPSTPMQQPATPMQQPATPIQHHATPGQRGATPVQHPATPVQRGATPVQVVPQVPIQQMQQHNLPLPKSVRDTRAQRPSINIVTPSDGPQEVPMTRSAKMNPLGVHDAPMIRNPGHNMLLGGSSKVVYRRVSDNYPPALSGSYAPPQMLTPTQAFAPQVLDNYLAPQSHSATLAPYSAAPQMVYAPTVMQGHTQGHFQASGYLQPSVSPYINNQQAYANNYLMAPMYINQ